jgi:heptosyltransferase-3
MNLLIIRPGAIGDTLLTFPVLRALRTQFTNPHITFVSNANVLPLAVSFGLAEEVSDYGHMQWGELFSTTGIHTPAVREQLLHTDLAICWLRDSEGLVERNLRKAGVRQVVVAPGRPAEGMHIHVVEYLAQTVGVFVGPFVTCPPGRIPRFIVGELAERVLIPSCPPPQCRGGCVAGWGSLPPPAERVSILRPSGKSTAGVKRGKEWDRGLSPRRIESLHNAPIAIHPGSGGAQKCWPTQCFATVIKWLWSLNGLGRHSHSVLLLAGPADQERVHDILDSIGYPPELAMLKVLVDAPLLEVAQQLQQCRCYLGNDSGITHLAAMLGVPTIALFGPSDPAIWHPVGPSVQVIRAQALERLGSDMVVEALESFLSL